MTKELPHASEMRQLSNERAHALACDYIAEEVFSARDKGRDSVQIILPLTANSIPEWVMRAEIEDLREKGYTITDTLYGNGDMYTISW